MILDGVLCIYSMYRKSLSASSVSVSKCHRTEMCLERKRIKRVRAVDSLWWCTIFTDRHTHTKWTISAHLFENDTVSGSSPENPSPQISGCLAVEKYFWVFSVLVVHSLWFRRLLFSFVFLWVSYQGEGRVGDFENSGRVRGGNCIWKMKNYFLSCGCGC